MTVLQVADLRFGYAGDTLFENVTFTLALGERAALVAPNGAGKSTLLRLIADGASAGTPRSGGAADNQRGPEPRGGQHQERIEPDAGQAVIKKEISFGYYRQSHELKPEGDVLGAFLSGFRDVMTLRDELTRAQEGAASGEDAALAHLANVQDRYHLARGDEVEREVAILAHKLGFSDRDLARPVVSLSGGERGRLQLGVVLAQQPDLLLLDEPTNHLDLDTIAWLESWLVGYRGALLVVSHDRQFLDNVCPKTLELGSRMLRVYPLKYSDYAVARAVDLERERALQERQQAFIDKTEDFIRKNVAGQKSKQAQSRRKMLGKLDRVERPEDVWQAAERIAFRFAPANRSGDIVLDCKGLHAERGGRTLFDGVEVLIRRGERIGIVGPNGAGKTTLLKLLSARGAREDRGEIRRGTNLQEGYFDQHLGEVDPALTAVDNVRRVRGDFTVEVARQYLARFRFYGDDTLRVVSGFSGGERSRLALAKLLLEPRNLLFLDEPTNHLDIPAAEILEEALAGFEGTVVLVSHDRRFLENTTTRIVSVRDGVVDVYPGGFRDYVAAHLPRPEAEDDERAERGGARKAAKKREPKPKPNPAEMRDETSGAKISFEAQRQAARAQEKRKRRIDELEKMIANGEEQLAVMRTKLKEDPGGDWAKIAALASQEQSLAKRVDLLMGEWAKLAEERQ